MSQIEPVQFTATIEMAGNGEGASFCVRVFDAVNKGTDGEVIHYHNAVKLDGGGYGPNEWLHELLTGVVEYF